MSFFDLTPPGKSITTMIIPKGTTGKIQPLDVYGFRIWKNFAKRFSDTVLLLKSNIKDPAQTLWKMAFGKIG